MCALAKLFAAATLAACAMAQTVVEEEFSDEKVIDGGEADYIVVGGGTAGCALVAQMCAAIPDKSFVLLERGKPRTEEEELKVRALRFAYDAWDTPGVSEKWKSTSNPNVGSKLLGTDKVDIIAGQTLGGTSLVNVAQWTVPDYSIPAGWGIDGLTAGEAERLYRKVEATVKPVQPIPELQQTYQDVHFAANERAGVDVLPQGVEPVPGDIRDSIWTNFLAGDPITGRRVDSCTAYLNPVRDGVCKDNLRVIEGAYASRVLFENDDDSTGRSATGVKYVTEEGGPETLAPLAQGGELFVTSGPYGSPKLLQLSGIGPKSYLDAAGIDQRVDLPVGADAQARPTVALAHSYTLQKLAPEANPLLYRSGAEEAKFRRGEPSLLGVNCFATDGILVDGDGYTFSSVTVPEQIPGIQNLQDTLKLHLSLCLLNPDSRAQVRVASKNPFESPHVDTNLLDTASDRAKAGRCLKRMRSVTNRWPFRFGLQEVLPGLGRDLPGIGFFTRLFERERKQAAFSTQNAYHFVAGCKVCSGCNDAVLDGKLRVKGFSNLRVVDSSAIPAIPEYVGPASSVYMLATYVAEQVIDDNGKDVPDTFRF